MNTYQPLAIIARSSLLLSVLSLAIFSNAASAGQQSKIGSTLNQKVDVNLDNIPTEILTLVNEAAPGFVLKEAEKEFKHGNTYFDIEGEKADGSEIEFDLMQVDNQWKIMEVQRDVTLAQCPPVVVETYTTNSSFTPLRIIESKQSTGETIYEFYSKYHDGEEIKHEVKFVNGKATMLTREWEH